MLTCSKVYRDIPFAHRQPRHSGHCSLIHGHNWAIHLKFACRETDDNGFVIDFGGLGFVRDWLYERLDHACLFEEGDPMRDVLVTAAPDLWKPYTVPNASAEGIARHLYEALNKLVQEHTMGRVWLVEVTVEEDARNAATYRVTKAEDCPYRDPFTA